MLKPIAYFMNLSIPSHFSISKIPKAILLIPFFLVAFFYVISISGNKDVKSIQAFQQEAELKENGYEITILYTELGKIKAKILAPVLSRYLNESGITDFDQGLKIFFFNEDNKVGSSLTADYGKAYEKEEELYVRDNVIVINTKGEKLNTEELIWKKKEKKIFSEKFVKIQTENEIIFGEGLEALEDFSEYSIKKVKGSVRVDATNF